MPNLDLTDQAVVKRSGISEAQLTDLFEGRASFDAHTRDVLRPALGDATDLLFNHQKAFDFYRQHRKWPSANLL
jgi:plasmid maintenance system antidote protein VapI